MKLSDIFDISTGYLKSRIVEDDNSQSYNIYSKKHFDKDYQYSNFDDILDVENIKLNKDKIKLTETNDIIIDSLSLKASVVSDSNKEMFLAFNYFRLTPKFKEVDLDYFCAWFNLSLEALDQLERVIQGTVIKKLSMKQLNDLDITLPGISTQVKIGKLYKESFVKLNLATQIKDNENDIITKLMEETSNE